jgi:hypothetical protein
VGPTPEFSYCQTLVGLLMWGALSDERTDLSFTNVAGPRQYSHPWVRVPRDSWPYFTVSDSRLPQPGGPGSLPYLYPSSGTGLPSYIPRHWVPFSLPPTTHRSMVDVFEHASTLATKSVVNCCWPSPAKWFFIPSPAGLMTIFYCHGHITPARIAQKGFFNYCVFSRWRGNNVSI